MDNLAFLPLGVLLFLFIRMSARRAIFYKHQSGPKEPIDHVRWYHLVIYYVWVTFFTVMILVPFCGGIGSQVVAFYKLHTGYNFLYNEGNRDELSKDLPDGEFIVGYETLRYIKPEKLVNEVIPGIIDSHRYYQQRPFPTDYDDYDLSGDFKLEYDLENDKFLLRLDREIAGEILVENTWFFKQLYFHYYRDVLVK